MKGTGKITKAPSGKSFNYTPREIQTFTDCPGCEDGIVVMDAGGFPTCNEQSHFICSNECGWETEPFQHSNTVRQVMPQPGPTIKSQPSKKQTEEFTAEFRRIHAERMEVLKRERAKFPPSLIRTRVKITKGKNKGKTKIVWKANPKFTDKMRQHMHTFAVDSEKIALEIHQSGIRRWEKPKAKGKK